MYIYTYESFPSVARTALTLPSIMTRIDEALLVKELNARMFDNVFREDLLKDALTPPAAEVGYNYERLEILGDDMSTFSSFKQSKPLGQAMPS